MSNLKGLAKDTAIYGLSSIVGRFLNYLLVPLYTAKLSGGKRRLRGYNQCVCLYGAAARHPYLRYGDNLLPLCQQGGRKSAESILNHAHGSRLHVAPVRGVGAGVHRSHFIGYGLCRASLICMGYGNSRCARRVSVHPVRISALQEAPDKVCRAQAL